MSPLSLHSFIAEGTGKSRSLRNSVQSRSALYLILVLSLEPRPRTSSLAWLFPADRNDKAHLHRKKGGSQTSEVPPMVLPARAVTLVLLVPAPRPASPRTFSPAYVSSAFVAMQEHLVRRDPLMSMRKIFSRPWDIHHDGEPAPPAVTVCHGSGFGGPALTLGCYDARPWAKTRPSFTSRSSAPVKPVGVDFSSLALNGRLLHGGGNRYMQPTRRRTRRERE